MVATIQALGGSSGGVAATADYFTRDVEVEYYTKGGERPGYWFGDGAKALGLSGNIDRTHFERLLAGQSPDGSRLLTQSQAKWRRFQPTAATNDRPPLDPTAQADNLHKRRLHNPGYDLTFSVPKSVSVWWALADSETQKKIDRIIDQAARETLKYIEDRLWLGRRGLGGREEERAGLVVGMFPHSINRNGDPQRHIHCIVINACQRGDSTWSSLCGPKLRNWTRTLGPMFRCQLGAQLREVFGVDLECRMIGPENRGTWFSVKGVPQPLVEHWSSRRRDIVDELKARGHDLGGSSAAARNRANLASRQSKSKLPPRDQLHQQWRRAAERLGFLGLDISTSAKQLPVKIGPKEFRRLVLDSAESLHVQESAFTYRQLLQALCERCEARGIRGTDIAGRLNRELEVSPHIRCLGATDRGPFYCTQKMWEQEERLLKTVQEMSGRDGLRVPASILTSVISKHPDLSTEQAEAVRILTQGQGALRALSGVAGAGKTRSLDVVREAFENSGYRVIGGALSGAAKEELAKQAKISARTVASYLYQLDRPFLKQVSDRIQHDLKQLVRAAQGKFTTPPKKNPLTNKTVLLLDEAGMLDTRLLARLLRQAEKAKATVILAGDRKQLQPIGPGGPFRYLESLIPNAKLASNRRQKDQADRQAVASIRQGNAMRALESYAERGRLSVSRDRARAERELVNQWIKAGGPQNPTENFVFTQTRTEAHRIGRQCQSARQQLGEVATVGGATFGSDRFYRGDRVMFHKANRLIGIENGYLGTVLAVKNDNLIVQLDTAPTPRRMAKRHSQIVTLPLGDLPEGALSLGYAATTHKMQGNAVANSFVLLGGSMTSLELSYVQATRARDTTRLFTDRQTAGDDLSHLAKAMSRSRPKMMAHEVREQAEQSRRPELRPEIGF
ncbi:MAG: relaxase domain-containing protein [Planctomycetota bacterium]|nr:relaxase domain-containing protein [Planctomycetota bacterium]